MRRNRPAPPSSRTLSAICTPTASLRKRCESFGERAGVLAQRTGEIGAEEMEDRRDAEEQRGENGDRQREKQHAHVDGSRIWLCSRIGAGHEAHQ